MLKKRLVLSTLLAACVVLAGGFTARADEYPSRPITLIVPFPPGGSTTIMARIIADRMSQTLNQQIVIDNRGGAGGTIGTRMVANSAPDGYTLGLGYTGTLAVGPSLYTSSGYDPRKDFAPIGLIGTAPSVLVVHPSVPAKTVAELIAYAKSSPNPLQYGSPGIGTANHLAGELFAFMSGIKMVHVPYRGSGPAMNDLLGGHIPLSFTPVPAAHGNVAAGTLRALATSGSKRSALMPELPTVAESGLAGFEVALRYGLIAPAGTPRAIIDRLNKELRAALDSDEVRKRLATEGAEPLPSSSAEYAADIDQEETKWATLIKRIGVKGQ
jgi:tripartite-type tricarboxylate transporter receptor subunit TctC